MREEYFPQQSVNHKCAHTVSQVECTYGRNNNKQQDSYENTLR